jgi:hypothetical protein
VDKVDQANWLERLDSVAINAKVKTVLASSDTAADEAVFNNVHKKKDSKTNLSFLKLTTSWLVWIVQYMYFLGLMLQKYKYL